MAFVRAHLLISGLVQGVAFRYYTRREASRLGLTGWVRNLSDGKVEAVFEGEEGLVAEMVQWCRQGPPGASVSGVRTKYEPVTGEFSRFDVTY